MKKLHIILFVCFVSMLSKTWAQTYAFSAQPDGTSGVDANLKSLTSTTNYGSETIINAERTSGGDINRGIFYFNTSSIPRNANILTAKLTLSGGSHAGTNAAYLRLVTVTWNEGTATWSNMSGNNSATGQYSLPTTSAATTTVDVKTHIQSMVKIPETNFGWMLMLQSEAATAKCSYASSDNATSSLRPKLEITYELPMNVSAFVTPCTNTTTSNGAINISVSEGVAPYTYSWSTGATTKDIYNLAAGMYTLTVTDANSFQVKKIVSIGSDYNPVTASYQPDALAGKDAYIALGDDGVKYLNTTGDVVNVIQAARGTSGGVWFKTRDPLQFDLSHIPSNAVVSSATLSLFGITHNMTTPNACYLKRITSTWDETTVTWNNQPTTTTTGMISVPATTSATENRYLDVTTHVQDMINNPSGNYGWMLMLQDETSASYRTMQFGSSDNTDVTKRPLLQIAYTIPTLQETDRNWQLTEVYDESGNVISSTKNYADALGRSTQNSTKDGNGDVVTTQTIYDSYGRPAITSMPAYTGTSLIYQNHFFQNNLGQEYNYTNFDIVSKLNNPDPVQSGIANTLGTWYSNSNSVDAYQATTSFPYSRTEYMGDPTSVARRSTAPGDEFKMGTNRESYSFSMVSFPKELAAIFGNNNSYKVSIDPADRMNAISTLTNTGGIYATKTIVMTPDNKEVISYSVGGKTIASCISGLSSGENCSISSVESWMNYYGPKSIDIHLPDANKSSVYLPLPQYYLFGFWNSVPEANVIYKITDLYTDKVLVSGTDYTINSSTRAVTFTSTFLNQYLNRSLVLRFSFDYTPGYSLGILTALPSAKVVYNLDYGRWSVNYYDLAGNLRKEVSAKGISCSNPGTITMATTYDYSSQGQLVAKQSPDEGLIELTYDIEGKLRFTQNAQQYADDKFSYISYDEQGRTVETGEYTTNIFGGANNFFQNYYLSRLLRRFGTPTSDIINQLDGLSTTGRGDDYHTAYEIPVSGGTYDIPSGYTYKASYNKFKNGTVCYSWNANTISWYNYSETGQLTASAKQIKDADWTAKRTSINDQIITTDNVYDAYKGLMNSTQFQKNKTAESLTHSFTYNANNQLSVANMAYTSAPNTQIASYTYNKMGQLKRVVQGNKYQGIDYVYTLHGKLKSINHPSLDNTKDPGADAGNYNGSTPTQVTADLFGEILDYYNNDYVRSNTNISSSISSGNSKYDGLIYATRFKTRDVVNSTNTGYNYLDYNITGQSMVISTTNYTQQELMFGYTYDQFNQLATATFNTYTNTTNSGTARTEYKETNTTGGDITYDKNGNITSLKRMATQGVVMDQLTYTIGSGNNKLNSILDAASNTIPSSFNFKTTSTSTPDNFTYNNNGQMTVSPAEGVSTITYYPNGQVKKVTFSNNNTSEYFYDDGGNKYKSKYYNASTAKTKINWYIGGAIYEYDEVVSTTALNLKELAMIGDERIGILKVINGVLGSNTAQIFEISDHLGNVRVTYSPTFSGNAINIASYTDYYAYGGTLPGHNWTSDYYRYGFQGQEKAQDGSLWEQFELRLYNKDLGRWFAPDPYGQFDSPYLAMANDPINNTDPDGGYVSMAPEMLNGRMRLQMEMERFIGAGYWDQARLLGDYRSKIEDLQEKYASDIASGKSDEFLNNLYLLNNQFAGMGLGGMCLETGQNQITFNDLLNNQYKNVYNKALQYGQIEKVQHQLEYLSLINNKDLGLITNMGEWADGLANNAWQAIAINQRNNFYNKQRADELYKNLMNYGTNQILEFNFLASVGKMGYGPLAAVSSFTVIPSVTPGVNPALSPLGWAVAYFTVGKISYSVGYNTGMNIETFTDNVAELLIMMGVNPVYLYGEHTKNARPSTKGKHEKGQTRKKQDRGGEKGDENRRPPNKRPNGWKGPWPPST